MKKILSLFFTAVLCTMGCQPDALIEPAGEVSLAKPLVRKCAANDVLQQQLAADPTLRQRMDQIEQFTAHAIKTNATARLVNGVIEIPVVVHVLYRLASENISDAQVQSQIDILNEDFNNTNADRNTVPAEFTDEQTSVGVRFVLDRIIRKYSSKRDWRYNDDMKKTSKGGSDPVDPSQYLNAWVVNKISYQGSYLFGFGQFPGGNPATDGIVVGHKFWGRTGVVAFPYDKGRTATHEVGHWLNLRHIWGDATCGDDLVSDTPVHNTSNFGCPTYPHKSTCAGTPTEMTVNYMDYTDDGCMVMFTNGQKSRMLAVFAPGGPRASFAQ